MVARKGIKYALGASLVGLMTLGGAVVMTPSFVEPLNIRPAGLGASLVQQVFEMEEAEQEVYRIQAGGYSVSLSQSGLDYMHSEVNFWETVDGGDLRHIAGRGRLLDQDSWYYSSVWYESVWNGIDMEVIPQVDRMVKVLYIEPFANPNEIQFETSVTSLVRNENGELRSSSNMLLAPPVEAWQDRNGKKVEIPIVYEVMGNSYGVLVGEYDESIPLLIQM